MTEFETTIPVDDDFLRDVDPEEKERRRLAYDEAVAEAAALKARRRQEASATGS
jgi:hypothetical protein